MRCLWGIRRAACTATGSSRRCAANCRPAGPAFGAAKSIACANEHVPQPSDANLAAWVRDRLDLPGRVDVGVQSTAQCGADLDATRRTRLWRRYAFQSAHRLPHVPLGHKCGTMHGHGFEAIVHDLRVVLRTHAGRGAQPTAMIPVATATSA